jgi:Calcineurin-like phosphoesterase
LRALRGSGRLVFLGGTLLVFGLLAPAAETPSVWSGVERVVGVGDLHGEYDNFVQILQSPKVGLVDENLSWIGGKAHLVQMGDVLDRGGRAKDILDLLMRLEKEAAAAGGMVHVLLGNHEEANLIGIALGYPDYVYVDQFFAFLPDSFKKRRENSYLAQRSSEEQIRIAAQGLDLRFDAGWRDYWEKILAECKRAKGLDEAGQSYTENFIHTYGKWLLRKNAVIKINDVIFVHAGINLRYSTRKLEEINETYRFELKIFARRPFNPKHFNQRFQPRIVYDPQSPVRIRQDEQSTGQEEMDRILANLTARRMVVGHNFNTSGDNLSPIVPAGDIDPLFGDKVWMIDTGIGNTLYGGRIFALIIDHGEFDHYTELGESLPAVREVPSASEALKDPGEIEEYLRSAVAAFVIPGGAGRTDPWKVRMDRGGIVRWAQFKYIDRPRPAAIPDSYRYELAAYAIDKHLGLGFVPPVVERAINDYHGSLQVFVDGAIRESERKRRSVILDDAEAFDEAMADLKVFINLVHDRCDVERDRDILIQNGTGKVFAVDFSQAFDPKADPIPGCAILRCSRALWQKLKNWDLDEVDRLVGVYLNGEELRALHARVGATLGVIRKQIEMRGESSVLF